ncbi:MAG: response regulator [Bavariicoccus seileri]|uniref:response regulator n=1 Tax=Bavariicoccus seileri TaxID=549685 RepID=UPI003F9A27FE
MRVLIAEDERDLGVALKTILQAAHYTVDVAEDGQEALLYLETQQYEGLILDIMMPKINGLQVLKQLRSEGNKTPVLLLTAKGQLDDKVIGLDAGADDYLTKPFEMKELLARVRALVRRPATFVSERVTVGNVSFVDSSVNC